MQASAQRCSALDGPLTAFLARLDEGAAGPHCLAAELAELPVAAASLAPYVCWRERAYTRNLLYRSASCELLAVAWAPGSQTPIHGHGGQACWLRLVAGRLISQSYHVDAAGRLGRAAPAVDLRPGDVDHRPALATPTRESAESVHRVTNPSAHEGALSLHLYAQPIARCRIYAAARGRPRQMPLRYDRCNDVRAPPQP